MFIISSLTEVNESENIESYFFCYSNQNAKYVE
jgi:hypothetical protein